MGTPIVIAKKTSNTQQEIVLHSQFANCHGLIAGATGTGKTVTLKVLAENFPRIGVPVFLKKEAEHTSKQREKMTQDIIGTFAKSVARSLGGSTGQKIVCGLLGSLFGRK